MSLDPCLVCYVFLNDGNTNGTFLQGIERFVSAFNGATNVNITINQNPAKKTYGKTTFAPSDRTKRQDESLEKAFKNMFENATCNVFDEWISKNDGLDFGKIMHYVGVDTEVRVFSLFVFHLWDFVCSSTNVLRCRWLMRFDTTL